VGGGGKEETFRKNSDKEKLYQRIGSQKKGSSNYFFLCGTRPVKSGNLNKFLRERRRGLKKSRHREMV